MGEGRRKRTQTTDIANTSGQEQGTVKWFSAGKGYGFITGSDGVDIFAHYTGITGDGYRSLEEGQAVVFERVKTDKGWAATNINVV